MIVDQSEEEHEAGTYGWPDDGVRRKTAANGGSIGFGWRLRTWHSMLLSADFHCVWVDATGKMIEITLPMAAGYQSLFVPDPAYPADFAASQRVPTRCKVLHAPSGWSAQVTRRIDNLKPGPRAYEERRAQKAGVTLEQWMLRRYPVDPLPPLIDTYLEACRAFEAKVQDLPELLQTTLAAANGAEPSAADLDRAVASLRSQMYDWSKPRHIAGRAIRIALPRTLHQPNM